MKKPHLTLFWHRRDLRLNDNCGIYHALKENENVLPIFIFDKQILDKLNNPKDKRVQFIHQEIEKLQSLLESYGSSMRVFYGKPKEVFESLCKTYDIKAVYTNNDYEPYARERDQQIEQLLAKSNIPFYGFKDHVIFEKSEIVKDDGKPYTVYTPYSKKWLTHLKDHDLKSYDTKAYFHNLIKIERQSLPSLDDMGFKSENFQYPAKTVNKDLLFNYKATRDIPSTKGTSRLSLHLRFGTLSIRELTSIAQKTSFAWLNELIWRNFYQMIIWHYPDSVHQAFKKQYDNIPWRKDEIGFKAWCEGKTGYPIVDAGMRELNATGFMHNRVRMITASFLTKHLLIDWRWGEAYFAEKLLDFELASNVGGWQWAASSGCDAAPYFRVFNPELQTKKFDPDFKYIKQWVKEYGSPQYPKPLVNHKMARERVLRVFKEALQTK